MSTVTASVTTCPTLQASLNAYFETCQFTNFGSPMLEFLYSDANRTGIQQLVNPASNKKRTVELVYDQPIWDEATTVADCDKVCDATTDRGDLSTSYYIDCTDGRQIEGRIRTSDWNLSCRNNPEVIQSRIMKMILSLEDSIAEKTAQELPPLVGGWSTDSVDSGLTIDVDDFLVVATKLSGGNVDPQFWQSIDLATMQAGYCNGQFVTGGSQLFQAMRLFNAGCCADQGLDVAEMQRLYGRAVTFDRWVAQEFGDDVSLIFQPGSTQLLTYTATDPMLNDIGLDIDLSYRNFWEGIIVSPRAGLPMDISLKNDCGVIHIVITCTTKAIGLPVDMFPVGHPLVDVNYLTAVQVTNP